jgi:hypothetical protein
MRLMEPQLFLLPDKGPAAEDLSPATEAPISWRLDDDTRARGHRGIARARAALRAAGSGPAPKQDDAPRRAAA